MNIEKYSLGIGDRFGFEGAAQLRALQKAEALGIRISPVWNKSNREHSIIGSSPRDTRREADAAVRACMWKGPYHVDADHIGISTVDRFIDSSDFFTIDVAESLGKPVGEADAEAFVAEMGTYKGKLSVPSMDWDIQVTDALLESIAGKYLAAVKEAGKVYRYIADRRGSEDFIAEVSMDEAVTPQTPGELFFILGAIAREGIPLQTIAPKFSGAFLKGVDYVGDPVQFAREFEDDLAVIAFAVAAFRLPRNLKISVHSGSDKFSLYPLIRRALLRTCAGIHVKTAGTTWLEEVIGLAEAGGAGLKLVQEVYAGGFSRFDELSAPYRSVIDIDVGLLPEPAQVERWSAEEFSEALRHDPSSGRYHRGFRQFMHIAYKVAAEMGGRFNAMLEECRETIEANVTDNLYRRHIRPLFPGAAERSSGRDQDVLQGRNAAS